MPAPAPRTRTVPVVFSAGYRARPMTFYELLVFAHVLMAAIWVGGSVAIQALAIRAVRSSDPQRVVAVASDAEWVGMRIFLPASLVLLGAGIWAAREGDWDFGSGWISIGFAIFIASFFFGAAFAGPESGRIARLTAEHGVAHPDVQRRIRRILALTRIELLAIILAVLVMVAKPGT